MDNATRRHFDAFTTQIAKLNGIPDGTKKFTVEPSIEQKLEDKIRESAGFLSDINSITVTEAKGAKLGLDIGSPVSSTQNTNAADRTTKDPSTLDEREYECTQTNFDTHIGYKKLDQWAKFPDFQTRITHLIAKQQARDRIMIGFNGTNRADTSNLVANPLLQDVNIGWLQHIRTDAPEHHMTGLKVGDHGDADFKNIDAAVMALADELLDEWYRDDTDLVAIMGRQLLSDKFIGLVDSNDAPTERNALETIITNKTVGGLKSVRVPFFPPRAVLVTRLDNLGIYTQAGTRRRHIKDKPERDRIEDYQSVNQSYVVEDYGLTAFAENILVPDGSDGWE